MLGFEKPKKACFVLAFLVENTSLVYVDKILACWVSLRRFVCLNRADESLRVFNHASLEHHGGAELSGLFIELSAEQLVLADLYRLLVRP